MEILIYGNRKQDDECYDISSVEKEEAAFLIVFKELDEYWNVYDGNLSSNSKKLYEKAKQGDGQAAKQLLLSRAFNEYEEVKIVEVINPLEIKE